MNIFCTSQDPIESGFDSCDSHSVKMPVEVAQMMSSAVYRYEPNVTGIYKPSYTKHPCTLWVGNSKNDFEWVYWYGMGLCDTYSSRYGKEHGSKEVIKRCYEEYSYLLPEIGLTPFTVAINVDGIKALGLGTIDAYRLFIAHKHLTKKQVSSKGKERLLIDWQKGCKPDWLEDWIEKAKKLFLN